MVSFAGMIVAHAPSRPMQGEHILESRIEALELTQQALMGQLKAIEYGLRAALTAHPDLPTLQHLWANMLPSIADAHLPGQADGPDHPMYHAALKQGLALITQQLDAAASATGGDHG